MMYIHSKKLSHEGNERRVTVQVKHDLLFVANMVLNKVLPSCRHAATRWRLHYSCSEMQRQTDPWPLWTREQGAELSTMRVALLVGCLGRAVLSHERLDLLVQPLQLILGAFQSSLFALLAIHGRVWARVEVGK